MARSTTGSQSNKLITFGEPILRLSTVKGQRVADADTLQFFLGGTELNISANLTSLGMPSKFVTVLPTGDVGDLIQKKIERLGVEFSDEHREEGRPAWYLLEQAPAPRGDTVLTRQKSILGDLETLEFNWAKLFEGGTWFHTSGVACGLSETCTQAIASALKAAQALGLKTSYDLNFRKNLWSVTESIRRQQPLLKDVDVLVLGTGEFETYFKTPYERDAVLALSEKQKQTFIVPRRSGELSQEYWIEVWCDGEQFSSKKHSVETFDRIGVGDSMFAGWIYAGMKNWDKAQAVDFAAACGALKYTIAGDLALLKANEVENFLSGGYQSIRR